MRFRSLFALTLVAIILGTLFYQFLDRPIILWVSEHHSSSFLVGCKVIQSIFSFGIWAPLTLLGLVYAWWKNGKLATMLSKRATAFWLGILFAMCITAIIKFNLGRYRPELFLLSPHLYGFSGLITHRDFDLFISMPSDHSAIIFAIVTALCFNVRANGLRILFCLIGIGCAAFRVIYLRHYPSDVIIGALIGMWGMSLAYKVCKIKVE